jgi:hypothetical protein
MADVFKFEVAMGTAGVIGDRLKKRRDELELRTLQCRGAHDAGKYLSKKFQEMQAVAKAECDELELEMDERKRIVKYINNCALLAEKYSSDQITLTKHLAGKMDGINDALKIVETIFKSEEAQMLRVVAAEQGVEPPVEAPRVIRLVNEIPDMPVEPEPAPEPEPEPEPAPVHQRHEITEADIKAYARKYNAAQLTTEAERVGVSTKGRKTDIARRILEALAG